MASETNRLRVYTLKTDDPLFGKNGYRISGDLYDLLPEESKAKFKSSLGERSPIGGGIFEQIAQLHSNSTQPMVAAWDEGNLDLEEYFENELEPESEDEF